ncbi:MAG: lantibiotic dehydratase [Balneolaceae bacterium]
MKIFPHTLVRIAGSPFDDLEDLRIQSSIAGEFYEVNTKREKMKTKINEELYEYIGSLTDTDQQNLLLNLKRDIYNDRVATEKELSGVTGILPKRITDAILEYFSLIQLSEEYTSQFETEYSGQTEMIRKQFRGLIRDQALQKGLLLSSKSLFKRIPSWLKKNPDQFSRSDLKAELGLLKYLTRIKAKTSPFSTFTNLAVCSHTEGTSHSNNLTTPAGSISVVVPKAKPCDADRRSGKASDHAVRSLNTYPASAGVKSSVKNLKQSGGNDYARKSHVRLNNAMFVYIRSLLFQYPDIYSWLPVSINPTVQKKGEEFVFLVNHNNIESFQRIPFTPIPALVSELVENQEQQPAFRKLVCDMKHHVEASEDDLSEYVKKLIDYGFLEFKTGVSGLDPDWDLKLREKLLPLERNNVPYVKELREMLKDVRETATKYEDAGLMERELLLNEAFDMFKTFCMNLHEAAGLPEEERMDEKELRRLKAVREKKHENGEKDKEKGEKKEEPFRKKHATWFRFRPETIFYEDTTLNTKLTIEPAEVEAIVTSMDQLLHFMQPFDGWRHEKEKMTHYFKSHHGGETPVPLFSFYENYYRDVKKPEAEKKRGIEMDPEREKENTVEQKKLSEKVKPRHNGEQKKMESDAQTDDSFFEQWKKCFSNLLETYDISQNGSIRIEQSHLQKVNEQCGAELSPLKRSSFGMFIQFFVEQNEEGEDQLKGVVNGVFPGFGRMMSRFLHLFDEKITEELCTWNQKLAGDDFLIENCDASCFNANIHPPLMPGEIRMPGSQNILPADKQIPVTDLFVQEIDGKLCLKNRWNNRVVYTFDLGFQGFKGHSQLFQLLSRFTLARFLFPHGVISAVNSHAVAEKKENDMNREITEILVYPRIEYENTLVLQRKRWIVPASKLPVQGQNESDGRYFLRLNEWRKIHDIPDEVFVTVFQWRNGNGAAQKKMRKIGKDDYKPQYIDFSNPLLVNLFSKLVRKVPFTLTIEEMLPGSGQLHIMNGKKFVTEQMIQWYHF